LTCADALVENAIIPIKPAIKTLFFIIFLLFVLLYFIGQIISHFIERSIFYLFVL